MRTLSQLIQKTALRSVAVLAVAVGVMVSATSLESLSTTPLGGAVKLLRVELSSSNVLLAVRDQSSEDESDTKAPDELRNQKPRYFSISVSAPDHPDNEIFIEVAKATQLGTRVWYSPQKIERVAFNELPEVPLVSSPNGVAVKVRTDADGKASLLLQVGRYLVASPKVTLWGKDQFAEVSIKQSARGRCTSPSFCLSLFSPGRFR